MHNEASPRRIDRRDFLRLGGVGLAGAVLLGTTGDRTLALTGPSLTRQFERSAREYKVPVELLLAIGYYNTLWEMPPATASDYEKGTTEGRGAYGIMQLEQNPSRDTLGKAASLTGLSEKELKNDRSANIEGAAAVLSDLIGKTKPADLNGWQEAVAAYADIDLYAQQVYGILERGESKTISTGENLKIVPQDVDVPRIYTARYTVRKYPGADWYPAYSGNYTTSRREENLNITRIVVHVTQGSYASAINWFQDPAAGVSAHYVVNRVGTIGQCVLNKDIAYHAGNWTYNQHSIGIEHAGYVDNPDSFTRRMYRASARLAAWCCKKHRIPVDRKHIIGHSQVPGATHTDPGKYWNWSRYIKLVRYYRNRIG